MGERVLYIHGYGYFKNDRGVITTLEWLGGKYSVQFEFYNARTVMHGRFHALRKIVVRGIELILKIHKPLKYLWLVFRLKPSFVYFREPRYPLTMYLIKRLFGNVRIVLDIRENPATHYKIQNIFLSELYCAGIIDKTLTISEDMALLLSERFSVDVHHFFVLPSSAFIAKGLAASRIKKEGCLKLCFFGDVKHDRDIHVVADALKRRNFERKVVFDIYGDVKDQAYLNSIVCNESNVTISYKGILSYEDSPSILSGYDCGVLTNRVNDNSRYTIPGKLWEYLACGLCVISNSRPSIDHIINNNQLGFIFHSDDELDQIMASIDMDVSKVAVLRDNVSTYFSQLVVEQQLYKNSLLDSFQRSI